MTDIKRIEELKRLAEKATPGPWAYEFTGEKSNDWCVGQVVGPDDELKHGEFVEGDVVVELVAMAQDGRLADARFIAAANPETVLWLIAQIPQWMPIESAPKDGSYLMLVDCDLVTIGTWTKSDALRDEAWIGFDCMSNIDKVVILSPTHWMPLPTPPTEAPRELEVKDA